MTNHAASVDTVSGLALSKISNDEEIHHRIANSLHLVSMMIAAAGREVVDLAARAILDQTQNRIFAIAGLHRQLYQGSQAGTVDLGSYLQDLGRQLEQSFGSGGRHVTVKAAFKTVSVREATSIGIITAELVSNALKYAYLPDKAGDIRVTMQNSMPNGYVLAVEDDGQGMSSEPPGVSGLGTRLVDMLSARLGASPVWKTKSPGTRIEIYVPQGFRPTDVPANRQRS